VSLQKKDESYENGDETGMYKAVGNSWLKKTNIPACGCEVVLFNQGHFLVKIYCTLALP
jgi:hypothetical protein